MNPVEEDRALQGEPGPRLDDGRRGRAAMDPTTRHLALIASGIGLLLVVLIGGWMLSGRHPGSIPVIASPPGPIRLKPVDPGGMQAMGAQAPPAVSGKGGETLAPKSETARPDALQAQLDAARRDGSGHDGGGQTAPAPTSPPRPMSQTPPAPRPAPPQVPHAPAQPAPGLRSGVLLRTDAGPEPAVQPGSGAVAVQLAAVGSDAAAQTEWTRLRHLHPALFSDRLPEVEQADHAGHAIYRLRTRGFGSAAEASSFCEQAHAQGVACTLADF